MSTEKYLKSKNVRRIKIYILAKDVNTEKKIKSKLNSIQPEKYFCLRFTWTKRYTYVSLGICLEQKLYRKIINNRENVPNFQFKLACHLLFQRRVYEYTIYSIFGCIGSNDCPMNYILPQENYFLEKFNWRKGYFFYFMSNIFSLNRRKRKIFKLENVQLHTIKCCRIVILYSSLSLSLYSF